MATRSPFFRVPFANSGDVTPIPVPVQAGGQVSFTQGYGPDYQRDQTTDPLAKPIDRASFNYMFNAVTAALRFWQTETFPEWVAAADNGGAPLAYPIGSIVRYRATTGDPFVNYISTADNNVAVPPGAGWLVFSSTVANAVQRNGDTMTGALNLFAGSTAPTPAVTVNNTQLATMANLLGRVLGVRVITAAGVSTNTPTPGTKAQYVKLQAGGGGSGGLLATDAVGASLSSGGGGGAYAEGYFTANFNGITITNGAGGTAGPVGAGSGGTGGTSSFGALLSASGGTGSSTTNPSASASGIVSAPAGGLTITGTATVSRRGDPGGNGFNLASSKTGGVGGAGAFGMGGGGGADGIGSPGVNPGSGGGGGAQGPSQTAKAGVAGAPGTIIIFDLG